MQNQYDIKLLRVVECHCGWFAIAATDGGVDKDDRNNCELYNHNWFLGADTGIYAYTRSETLNHPTYTPGDFVDIADEASDENLEFVLAECYIDKNRPTRNGLAVFRHYLWDTKQEARDYLSALKKWVRAEAKKIRFARNLRLSVERLTERAATIPAHKMGTIVLAKRGVAT